MIFALLSYYELIKLALREKERSRKSFTIEKILFYGKKDG